MQLGFCCQSSTDTVLSEAYLSFCLTSPLWYCSPFPFWSSLVPWAIQLQLPWISPCLSRYSLSLWLLILLLPCRMFLHFYFPFFWPYALSLLGEPYPHSFHYVLFTDDPKSRSLSMSSTHVHFQWSARYFYIDIPGSTSNPELMTLRNMTFLLWSLPWLKRSPWTLLSRLKPYLVLPYFWMMTIFSFLAQYFLICSLLSSQLTATALVKAPISPTLDCCQIFLYNSDVF